MTGAGSEAARKTGATYASAGAAYGSAGAAAVGSAGDGVGSQEDSGGDITTFSLISGPRPALIFTGQQTEYFSQATLMGIARPMPSDSKNFAEAMPMTSVDALITGPPELPGLIGASNWMKGPWSEVASRKALTTPVVTVSLRPCGEP